MIHVFFYPFSRKEMNDRFFLVDEDCAIPHARDDVQLMVFRKLRHVAREQGIEVHTADFFETGQIVPERAYFYFMSQWPYEHLLNRDKVVLSAYHIWEPPVLVRSSPGNQFNHLEKICRDFKRVYAVPTLAGIRGVVPELPEVLPIRKGYICQPYDEVIPEYWSHAGRKHMVLINNYQQCNIKSIDLYAERVRAARYFGEQGGLDIFGNGWDDYPFISFQVIHKIMRSPRKHLARMNHGFSYDRLYSDTVAMKAAKPIKRSYRGSYVADKLKLLSEYTFCLCYESSSVEGFFTEKLYDCLVAGTIPIYSGPPDITRYIPASCFIDRRTFSSYSQLHAYLSSLNKSDISAYREAGRAFLVSDQYRNTYSQDAFIRQFIADVREDAAIYDGVLPTGT